MFANFALKWRVMISKIYLWWYLWGETIQTFTHTWISTNLNERTTCKIRYKSHSRIKHRQRLYLLTDNVAEGSGQFVPKTTRTQDNSYPGQLVPKTTRTQDNSNPGQLVPRTTITQDDSYPGQLIPRTTRTQDDSYPGQLIPKTTHSQHKSYPGQLYPSCTQDNSYAGQVVLIHRLWQFYRIPFHCS